MLAFTFYTFTRIRRKSDTDALFYNCILEVVTAVTLQIMAKGK